MEDAGARIKQLQGALAKKELDIKSLQIRIAQADDALEGLKNVEAEGDQVEPTGTELRDRLREVLFHNLFAYPTDACDAGPRRPPRDRDLRGQDQGARAGAALQRRRAAGGRGGAREHRGADAQSQAAGTGARPVEEEVRGAVAYYSYSIRSHRHSHQVAEKKYSDTKAELDDREKMEGL